MPQSSEEVTVAQLERCLDRVALEMQRVGKRGVAYLPIYERLESELAAMKAKEAAIERARNRLAQGATRSKAAMPPEDEKKPDNAPPTPENVVPLKDRLSLSPDEASALTGIGLTSRGSSAGTP